MASVCFRDLHVAGRLVQAVSLAAAAGINPALFLQDPNGGGRFLPRQTTTVEKFLYGRNPVFVQAGICGKLVRMAAALDDQGPVHKMDGVFEPDAEPQVIIFTGRQVFIKTALLDEKFFFDHYGRRADQTE